MESYTRNSWVKGCKFSFKVLETHYKQLVGLMLPPALREAMAPSHYSSAENHCLWAGIGDSLPKNRAWRGENSNLTIEKCAIHCLYVSAFSREMGLIGDYRCITWGSLWTGSMDSGGWEVPWSVPKLAEAQESRWCSSKAWEPEVPRAGQDRRQDQWPSYTVRQWRNSTFPLPFCSVWAEQIRWRPPTWRGPPAFLSPIVQMLISSQNTFTDTPRNIIQLAMQASWQPGWHKVRHHTTLTTWSQGASPATSHTGVIRSVEWGERSTLPVWSSFQNPSTQEGNIRKARIDGHLIRYLSSTLQKLSRSWKSRGAWQTVTEQRSLRRQDTQSNMGPLGGPKTEKGGR